MVSFTKKTIAPAKRVCLCLKEARERKGISLEELSQKTRMNKTYLLALEECRWQDLPFSEIYQKHFIRSYTEAIGIDPAAFVRQFTDEEAGNRGHRAHLTAPPFSNRRQHNVPLVLRYAAMISVVLLCLGYLGLQVKRIVEPPTLTIYSPIHGLITSKSALSVAGKTEPEVHISINGAAVMQNERGEFAATIDLPAGVNTIVITAKKKHGKTTTETRHVIVKTPNQFSLKEDPQSVSGHL